MTLTKISQWANVRFGSILLQKSVAVGREA